MVLLYSAFLITLASLWTVKCYVHLSALWIWPRYWSVYCLGAQVSTVKDDQVLVKASCLVFSSNPHWFCASCGSWPQDWKVHKCDMTSCAFLLMFMKIFAGQNQFEFQVPWSLKEQLIELLSCSWSNFDGTTEMWRSWNVALPFKQSHSSQYKYIRRNSFSSVLWFSVVLYYFKIYGAFCNERQSYIIYAAFVLYRLETNPAFSPLKNDFMSASFRSRAFKAWRPIF